MQITRQRYRGRRWHVVHDPASNKFYRINPVSNEFVGLLDGVRTVEEAWNIVLDRHADLAPTQPEIIQLISSLYNANLLSIEASPETEQLLRRQRDRLSKKIKSQAIGIMYFRVRLFNPDGIISAVEPVLRPLMNRWGFLAWCVFVVFTLTRLGSHTGALADGFKDAIAPSNWGWLIGVYVVAKVFHEMGHGVICKRFGGQVPEFGALLLVLVPSPYVDASACWGFASRWHRVAVGSGGMIFELFFAGIMAHIWLSTGEGTLMHQIAYNAMLTAGLSTVLFNANPLMRFDGYYIMSDLLEIPNMMQRSFQQLQYLIQKYVYRLDDVNSPTTQPGEAWILTVYGIGALIYRVFLFITITLYVMGKLFVIGLILAIWTAAAWFIMPVGKLIKWLSTGPKLADQRGRTIAITLGMLVVGVGLVGLVPMPDVRRGVGVVESLDRTGVYIGEPGFVIDAFVRPGDYLEEGQVIAVLESPQLESHIAMARGVLAEFESIEREATAMSPSAVPVARERVAAARLSLEFLQERAGRLVVYAPHAGRYVGTDPHDILGQMASAGEVLGEVVDTDNVRIAASMNQHEAAWLFDEEEKPRVTMRPVSMPGVVIGGTKLLAIDAGQAYLPHASLGFAGGGTIRTDRQDQTGLHTETAQFIVYIEPEKNDEWSGVPGERVHLRFRLGAKPLAVQWIDRLHKLIQGRVQL
ncbi:hypothetical protein JYS44_00495 [Phycisphaeraceae bacterium AH-315-B13]|nr:hypothetical protein [Phycisphaeraceae bacterium AH-315-B13]